MTLGAPFALTAVQSAKNAGSTAKIGTFDTNAALVDAIQGGTCSGPSTSSRTCRATWPIDSLWLYLNNKNLIGGGEPTLTGPSFIDKSNIDAVAELAKAGTR